MSEAQRVIKFKCGEEELTGYEFGDANASAAVIVLQEAWGITEQIKEQALLLSQKGFRTFVPDLYKGKSTLIREEIMHLAQNFDWPQGVKEIEAAKNYLMETGAKKVGAIGFCMGGALALASATLYEGFSAVAPFYGIPKEELCDVSTIKVPVQGHFGELDKAVGFSDPEAVKGLEKKLDAAGATYEIFRYDNVGHGFMNTREEMIEARRKGGVGDYEVDQNAIDLAWERVGEFFHKYLD